MWRTSADRVARRDFLGSAAGVLAGAWGYSIAVPRGLFAFEPAADGEIPPLQTISGSPRERGASYGREFRDAIHAFLDREIYAAFISKPAPKVELLRYAAACGKAVREYSPVIYAELEGMAQGANLELEEALLLTLHEELYHRGDLPKVGHCTAVAVGPPATARGETFVGQTWDWMQTVFGLSRVLHWQRTEGPSLLAYGYPGLWTGAGLNSAGLALCWTSASLEAQPLGVRVGLPSYVLLTHLLYQESLDDALSEAARATNAGWFTFVMADGKGNLANIEGSPRELVTESIKGRMARVGYGSRKMTRTPGNSPVAVHPRCEKMCRLLDSDRGKIDLARMQLYFEDPAHEIQVGKSTIDMMVFNTTAREAFVSRGPAWKTAWKRFTFDAP
jgi:isopenicillin-N N-acyltransferase-like protein